MTNDVSQYERKRQQLIEENQKLLQELGLTGPENDLAPNELKQFKSGIPPPRKKPRNSYSAPKPVLKPTRLSRRLKGEEPDDTVDLEEILDQNDKMRQVSVDPLPTKTKQEESFAPDSVSTPITLLSIGTTIWELGHLNAGKNRSKWWSGRGCRYKHPYPIGFKATKSHFGNDYTMTIEEGDDPENGPIFKVQVNSSKTVFTGLTPTAPWTDACKKSKSQGTRVSGPLFYGFSDIITMRMIENMEGYDLASKPMTEEEL